MTNPIPQDVIDDAVASGAKPIKQRYVENQKNGLNKWAQKTVGYTFTQEQLDKFSELQRARQVVPALYAKLSDIEALGKLNIEWMVIVTTKQDDVYTVPLFTQPPTQQATHQQITNAALEKAVGVVVSWAETAEFYGFDGDASNYRDIAKEIEAIMQQPIEQAKDKP